MFGKRPGAGSSQGLSAVRPAEPIPSSAPAVPVLSEEAPARSAAPEPAAAEPTPFVVAAEKRKSEEYYQTKGMIFGALIEAIDLAQLSRLEADAAREEIRDIVNEIIGPKNVVMSIAEQEELLDDICNDVLGYGPLEPLLARDDIADVMVNGANKTYIEVSGKIQLTNVRFRDNQQLMNICQRIVSQVGRRVDESSPICDARLPDGSRVNVNAPQDHRQGALQRRDLRRNRLRQDDTLELPHELHRARRARDHLRGRGRAAAPAAACRAARDPAAEPRRAGPDHDARPRAQLPAHAARTHHRRRGSRRRSLRPAPGHEHGPRRLHGHAARELAAGVPVPA